MNFYIHPLGVCESQTIGDDTRIWAFSHVLPSARIGRECNVCNNVFIENDVIIGDRVTIKCGVQLWDGIRVGDDVFIGPNATFTNDKFPRSKQHLSSFLQTKIENGASIGGKCYHSSRHNYWPRRNGWCWLGSDTFCSELCRRCRKPSPDC